MGREADFLKGVLVGGLIGAALGILFAPKSGKETREDIARKTEELVTKAKEEYERNLEKSKKAYDNMMVHFKSIQSEVKRKAEEVHEKLDHLADTGKEALDDSRSRLKKAVDAGIEAYKEEKERQKA
ncbi:MAG: YtxH domain-containing protein [Syntrophales bacterium]|nr:YtxH domain-containing protein [Syntrophales bacterium]MDD5232300.1 YtxH domain-containing protein [Syntrophales bacterium]MDD5532733.1 YtxH domain-containing protein [Syntrophales bacterium]HPL62587.1 YtxH domain-containing protein [Syntrophales bacterium]